MKKLQRKDFMKLACLLGIISSFCFSIAALAEKPGDLKPDAKIYIPYSTSFNNLDEPSEFMLDITDERFYLQDLHQGKLLLVSRPENKIEETLDLPKDLLSLYFSDSGKVFGLTRTGCLEFKNRDELMRFLKNDKTLNPPLIKFNKGPLNGRRANYLLSVDESGCRAVWDKAQALILIFNPEGGHIDSYPCQSIPILSDRKTFISSYFAPEHGARIIEFGYVRPSPEKGQQETGNFHIELKDKNEFQVSRFDKNDKSFLGVVFPPSMADFVGNEPEDENQNRISGEDLFKEFTDPADPGNLFMIVARVTGDGIAQPLVRLPFGDISGKLKVFKDTLYHLAPDCEIASDAFKLKQLIIFQKELK